MIVALWVCEDLMFLGVWCCLVWQMLAGGSFECQWAPLGDCDRFGEPSLRPLLSRLLSQCQQVGLGSGKVLLHVRWTALYENIKVYVAPV